MKNKVIFIGLSLSLLTLVFSFFASSSPDGLRRVAGDKKFCSQENPLLKAPFADYKFPKVKNEKASFILSGSAGVLLVFFLSYTIAALINRKKGDK